MKTGIYVRCSNEAGESATLETQKDLCIKFCEIQGWNHYEFYEDDGYSAASINRPDFQRLLEDAKQGVIDTILVWRLDRFSRSLLDSVNIIEDLKEWNCNLRSVTETFIDLQDNYLGQTFFNIIMTFAQYERESIAERLLTNRRKYIEQGQMTCGQAPFGYDHVTPNRSRNEDRKPGWHINEKEAEIVRKVFDLYITEHLSAPKIAHRLLADGGPKDPSTIRNILTRECYYTGKLPLKYTVYSRKKDGRKVEREKVTGTATLEPIIDKKTWEQAQRVREAHLSRRGRHKKAKFLFQGKIRCSACDKPLYYLNQSGGYSYYAHHCAHGRMITLRSGMVDEGVWTALVNKLQNPVELRRTIEALKEKHPENDIISLKDQRNAIEAQIKALQRDIQKLSDRILITKEVPVIEAYEKKISQISKEISGLENSKDRIEDQIEEIESIKENIKDAKALVREIQKRTGDLENLTFEQKIAIVDKIYPPGSILFFPRWYLKLGPERDETLTHFSLIRRRIEQSTIHLDLDLAPAGARKSSTKVKKGILVCLGVIDEDFYEARKKPDIDKLKKLLADSDFLVNAEKR